MQTMGAYSNGANGQVRPVVRFAPSPNGYLHLGHAYSALRNFEFARANGGRFLLRIEDIDIGRARPEFEAAIFEDMAWLGIEWEEPVRRQSDHFSDYAIALEKLAERGLIYPCVCTRSEIQAIVRDRTNWQRDPDGSPLYPGTCRVAASRHGASFAANRPVAQRIDMAQAIGLLQGPLGWREFGEGDSPRLVSAEPSAWGDVVLGRKDVPGSYHIAVVVDDALQGVTDIVRGMDLFEATSLHRLLQELLDLPAPNYRHHRLIEDEAGRKMSKSIGSMSLRELRTRGVTPEEIRARLGLPFSAGTRSAF